MRVVGTTAVPALRCRAAMKPGLKLMLSGFWARALHHWASRSWVPSASPPCIPLRHCSQTFLGGMEVVGWAGGLDPTVCRGFSESQFQPSGRPLLPACRGQLLPASCFCLSQIARALCILACWACLESPPSPFGKHFTFCPMFTPCPAVLSLPLPLT